MYTCRRCIPVYCIPVGDVYRLQWARDSACPLYTGIQQVYNDFAYIFAYSLGGDGHMRKVHFMPA